MDLELTQLLEKELQELQKSANEKEVRYIRIDDGHNYAIALSKDCIYIIDSTYLRSYYGRPILRNLTTHSILFKDMPIYALGTQMQFDNVSCLNFTPESIFTMDEYLTNNNISLKEFITNKNNFVSEKDNYIDNTNSHIITDIPKCLLHLMQRSEEYIEHEYNKEEIKNTVIKKKEGGTEITVKDEITKNRKIASNGKIVNGTLDYKRQKSMERVVGEKVKIITSDEMCEKLMKYKDKVADLEKYSTRLEQLDEKLFYMNRRAYDDEGNYSDILIEELDNGERIVHTAIVSYYSETRSEDIEAKIENDKIKDFISNIKYKEYSSDALKDIGISINTYNFKYDDDIKIFIESLCDKVLEGCEFIDNRTNEEFDLLLLIKELSKVYNIVEYRKLLETFEERINNGFSKLSSDLEKNKRDYDDICDKYNQYEKSINDWKIWEDDNLDNLNKYNLIIDRKQELYEHNDQLIQVYDNLTKGENLLTQDNQYYQKIITFIKDEKRSIDNQYQQCLNEENELTPWFQEQQHKIEQYEQWLNHDKQEAKIKLENTSEDINKEIQKKEKIIKNIEMYKIRIIKESEKDLNNKNLIDTELKNNLNIHKKINIGVKEDNIVIKKENTIINIKQTENEDIYSCINNYLEKNKTRLTRTKQNVIKDVLNEICKLKVSSVITR